MKRKISLFFTMIFTFSLFTGCSLTKTLKEPLSQTELFMGTVITVTLYDKGSEEILEKAFNRVKEIEALVSINSTGETELTAVNENSGIKPVKVSEDTFNMVRDGLKYSQMSKGSFDISVGPLVKLWSIGLPEAKVPTESEIKGILPKVDYNSVKLNEEESTIFLEKEGMMLDLGAVAKGYTADEITELLDEEGVESAIVDLGGNIFAHGMKNGKDNWKIGIQDPLSDRGESVGVIEVTDKSIVTSGVYERYLEKDGVKYHHILDPKTGYPYENNIAGISIISDKSIDGDCLSTLVFSLGIEKGLEFIETQSGIDAIFITKENEVYVTDGLKDNFKVTNAEFNIKEK